MDNLNNKECPVCHKVFFDIDRVCVSIEYNYEHWEYGGFFGGKPESGDTLVSKTATGTYKCLCGANISIQFNGEDINNFIELKDYVITGFSI